MLQRLLLAAMLLVLSFASTTQAQTYSCGKRLTINLSVQMPAMNNPFALPAYNNLDQLELQLFFVGSGAPVGGRMPLPPSTSGFSGGFAAFTSSVIGVCTQKQGSVTVPVQWSKGAMGIRVYKRGGGPLLGTFNLNNVLPSVLPNQPAKDPVLRLVSVGVQ